MTDAFIGEIRAVGFTFAPRGWALCDGQLLPTASNAILFGLIGTTYGGDGQTTFALPDLRGRGPLGMGQGSGLSARVLGGAGGTEQVTLTLDELPAHTHAAVATSATGTQRDPRGRTWAASGTDRYTTTPTVGLDPQALSPFGVSGAHNNLAPYLTLNFVIALQGADPTA